MTKHTCLFALLAGAWWSTTLLAQPVPKITSLSREWFSRGATNEITISGENLQGATAIRVSGDPGVVVLILPRPEGQTPLAIEASKGGIAAEDSSESSRVRAQIVVGEDASLNRRELRIVSDTGVSNPLPINVSPLPESGESRSGTEVQDLSLPTGVSGTVSAPGEQDIYRFSAKAGEQLIFEVLAFRAGSPLDPSLAILDSKGQELARSEDVKGFDSYLHFKVPEDGQYQLQLRDFRYEGSSRHFYHLTAGALPCIDNVFPPGGERGRRVQVKLRGENLGGMESITLHPAMDAPIGWQEIRVRTPEGLSTAFPFHVSDIAEALEKEPNNSAGEATAVTPPVTLNGRVGAAKDVDHYKIRLPSAQTLICEVTAQRFGSPLDAVLVLNDMAGKTLQQNDDAEGADARIEFAFEKEKDYILSIRDLLGRGGEPFIYRLSIRPPAPAFAVRFTPDTPRLNCGGRAVIRCEVTRRAGFAGPVQITCEDLPAGVKAEPILITPDDPTNALLIIEASNNAAGGLHPFKLAARGMVEGQSLEGTTEPMSGEMPVGESLLTVVASPPLFTLQLAALSLALEQDQTAKLHVHVQRRPGFDGEIKLVAEGYSSGREPLSRNVDVQPVTLKTNEALATLSLKARSDSEVGTRPLYVRGEAAYQGETIIQYSDAIPLTLKQLPFTLNNTMKRLSVAVLPSDSQSAASEAEFAVRASRRGWFTDQIDLTLEGLPEGVTATSTNLPNQVREVTFKLTATEKAIPDKDYQISVVGSANVGGRTYRQRTEPITLSITKPSDLAEAK